ncbi:MAG: S-layer homology domain-containing protein, partial [Bacilli bacterium]
AMAFGAVVPAFANEVSTLALATQTVDARLASGYTPVGNSKVYTRAEIFNYNGKPSDRKAHTLKSMYADKKILVEKFADKPENDRFVLGEKNTNTVAVAAEKAKLAEVQREISNYKADGYKVVTSERYATITDGSYSAGEIVVTLTKSNKENITVKFINVDVAKEKENSTEKELTDKLRNDIFGGKKTDNFTFVKGDTSSYLGLNTFINKISMNLSKFDVVVDEDQANNGNVYTLYRKDAAKKSENLVLTYTVKDIKNADKKKIYVIPETNDFKSHWAADEILKAMLNGQVDATGKYRPEDGITRAEFAKTLCTIIGAKQGFEEDKTYKETFHDVVSGTWYQNYVGFLQGKKIVQGDGENFRPNDKITRQEVAVMVSNALNGKNMDDLNANMIDTDKDGMKDTHASITKPQLKELVSADLADAKNIAAWADHSVYDLVITKNKVINGDGKNFNPTKNITRAEALVMVQRASTKVSSN